MYKEKNKFILDTEHLDKILNIHIKKNFPQVDFEIRKSLKTCSIYLTISNKNNVQKTLRISNHYPPQDRLKTVLICNNTKNKKVLASINNEIKRLQRKTTKQMFEQIRSL